MAGRGEGIPYQTSADVEEDGCVDDPKITQLRIGTCLNDVRCVYRARLGMHVLH